MKAMNINNLASVAATVYEGSYGIIVRSAAVGAWFLPAGKARTV